MAVGAHKDSVRTVPNQAEMWHCVALACCRARGRMSAASEGGARLAGWLEGAI